MATIKSGTARRGGQARAEAKMATMTAQTVTSRSRGKRGKKYTPMVYMGGIPLDKGGQEKANIFFRLWPWARPPDPTNASHRFGFIPANMTGDTFSIINHTQIREKVKMYVDGSDTPIEQSVIMGRSIKKIKVTLDKLYIGFYPGDSADKKIQHRILFEFSGKNQVKDQANCEEIKFSQTYNAYSGGDNSVTGQPIFIGLNVSDEGVAFGCRTVNVQNKDDHMLLDVLNSQAVSGGLKLAETFQPALSPLVSITKNLTEMFLKRNDNKEVQSFSMGLDFRGSSTSPRLALGSYVAVQVPNDDEQWRWDDWVYDGRRELIVRKKLAADGRVEVLGYNYIIFGVTD